MHSDQQRTDLEGLTVYGMSESGNCYKLQLLLNHLQQPYHWVEVDMLCGETRQPRFLAINPRGKVPAVQLADGRVLTESNAIMFFLAEGSAWMPVAAWQRAQCLQWLFYEQYSHEPNLAVARFIRRFLPGDDPRHEELPRLHERGEKALAEMEQHLQQAAWFSGLRYGIADIALYAYTHVAEEGGFSLAPYTAVQGWLERVAGQPNHREMASI